MKRSRLVAASLACTTLAIMAGIKVGELSKKYFPPDMTYTVEIKVNWEPTRPQSKAKITITNNGYSETHTETKPFVTERTYIYNAANNNGITVRVEGEGGKSLVKPTCLLTIVDGEPVATSEPKKYGVVCHWTPPQNPKPSK